MITVITITPLYWQKVKRGVSLERGTCPRCGRNIDNETSAILYLQSNGLMRTDTAKYKKCQSGMNEIKRNGRIAMRCKSRSCNNRYSIRSLNHFFHYEDKLGRRNSKTSLSNIIEIMYYFLHGRHLNVRQMREIVEHYHTTLVDWLTQFREVCALASQHGSKLVGTFQHPVQVDESYFSGRLKYGKGRLMSGNVSNKKRTGDDMENEDDETTQSCSTGTKKNQTQTSMNWLLQHLVTMERE